MHEMAADSRRICPPAESSCFPGPQFARPDRLPPSCRSLSEQSGHRWACYWFDPVAIDPSETSSATDRGIGNVGTALSKAFEGRE